MANSLTTVRQSNPNCVWLVMSGIFTVLSGLSINTVWAQESLSGDAVIRAPAGDSEIVITTTSRLAGAIHSLTWNGQEFIDSFDHGRQLQSASNFDAGGPFVPEVFNPTEAGSMSDGAGPTSTSRLLELKAQGHRLETRTQMAFWLRPGEFSQGHPARNREPLSQHLLRKEVTIGLPDFPQVIQYDVTFTLPAQESHRYAQFEAVTGYMPNQFTSFWKFDPAARRLVTLDHGPGEQAWPVVLSTPDGAYAMGVYSPDQPAQGFEAAGYGRFRFPEARVNKWNCVFRIQNKNGVPAGDYRYRCYVLVGTRADVERDLGRLMDKFR